MGMELARIARRTDSVFLFVADNQRERKRSEKNGGARELARVWYYYHSNERKATMK